MPQPLIGVLLTVLAAATPTAAATPPIATPPSIALPTGHRVLLDTRCEPAEWSDAARVAVTAGVDLLLKQDPESVFLCLTMPEGSYGTLDLYLQPAAGEAPWDLHVSAEVGERRRGPAGWPEWQFGNHRGWFSPAVPLRGAEVVDGRARLTFTPVEGREVQLERSRFGDGPWRVMLELRALGPARDGTAVYPPGALVDQPATWATWSLGAAAR
ncbi:MAG TPA: hypothetical protein VGV61_06695 [Thermoanaerobaculia bacterium]|jgi:hypothetical protein|nr:hypothetical protein [Thermoanaerobaculia bacterium]